MSPSLNTARQCLFCATVGPLSREHVWPRWIAKLLPAGHRFSSRGTVGRHDGQPQARFGDVFESVDSCSWTARAVCGSCNNDWMSALESEAQPILGPLVTGESTTVLGADLRAAFRWAVKTAIVIGAGTGNLWRLEPCQAAALRDGHAPKGVARVSLAWAPEGLDGWAHVERLTSQLDGRPGALFVEAVRGHLALSVALAPSVGGLPAWDVLVPPGWAPVDPPAGDTTLPAIELAEVWGVSLARLKLVTMVGQAEIAHLPVTP